MTEKYVFKTHFASLSALFVLGSGVITLPVKNADAYTVYAFLISLLFSFAVYFFVLWMSDRIFGKEYNSSVPKILSAAIYIAVAIYALFCFAHTFKTFTRFAADILLKDTSYFTAAILFGLVIWFFASRRQENILKFALLCFFAALPVIIFFFLGALGDYEVRNIFIFALPDFKTLLKNLLPFIKEVTLPLIILTPYCASVFGKGRIGSTTAGIAIGYLLLGLCISSSLMLFGPEFAAKIEYPYTAAVSTVIVGRLFTRMDYFSYFIYLISAIIRITVCIFTVRECLKRLDRLCKPT